LVWIFPWALPPRLENDQRPNDGKQELKKNKRAESREHKAKIEDQGNRRFLRRGEFAARRVCGETDLGPRPAPILTAESDSDWGRKFAPTRTFPRCALPGGFDGVSSGQQRRRLVLFVSRLSVPDRLRFEVLRPNYSSGVPDRVYAGGQHIPGGIPK
jgi:hypothetical protein